MDRVISPGIYQDVPYDEYASWPAVRSSTLNACYKSMAHGRYAEENPKNDENGHLVFGKALHCKLLEPDKFKQQYTIAPNIRRNTKEWFSIVAGSPKHFLKQEEYDLALALIDSAYSEITISQLLKSAIAKEVSFVWEDTETGLLCKGRADFLTTRNGWTVIADIKTTRNANHYGFQRDVVEYGYYRSMAFYQMGLHALHPAERKCVLIALEKTPPYCAVAYELDDQSLLIGELEMQDLLRRYAECKREGKWPGYASGVVPLGLPGWKVAQHERDNKFTDAA